MSVVIIGGNECMVRQYKDICSMYKCKAKIYPKMTNTVSHKMVRCALSETKGLNTKIARSHSSSMAALKSILEEHTA